MYGHATQVLMEVPSVYGVPVAGLTAPALLSIVVLLILYGRLIPRSMYDQVIKERDAWHDAHTTSETARLLIIKQLDTALEVGRSVQTVMSALAQAQARGEDRAGVEEGGPP